MTGFNAAANRTAIGLAVNLPQFRYNDTYQVQNNLTQVRGNHLFKAGLDVRRPVRRRASSSRPSAGCSGTRRSTRSSNDVAEAANINKPLPGGEDVNYYRWWDQYYFAQDDWRIGSNLTLNLGLRYELPGNNIAEPDRAERAHRAGEQRQPGLRAEPGAEDATEQLPAAARLQLAPDDRARRHARV